MADDDRDTDHERARLEGVAWGAGSSPAEAARARIALADLGRRKGQRAGGATAAVTPPSASTAADTTRTAEARATEHGAAPEHLTGSEHLAGSERATTTVHETATDPGAAATVSDQGAAGLQDGAGDPVGTGRWGRVRDRVLRVVRSARARPWVAGGVAAGVVVAFGTGLVVGTVHPALPASPVASPTPGTVTLEQLLDAPQTYADQLPGSIEAPVSLHSTRLVFTNRSLSGDDAATPWNVWAGVGTDKSTICLVATANRIEATSACYPREDALHGAVSLTAQSLSGTLIVELSGGGVQGRVAAAF